MLGFLARRKCLIVTPTIRDTVDMYRWCICLFSLACFFIRPLFAHPQCLDFRPPWKSNPPLTFCTQYADFGCCTAEEDTEIYHQYVREMIAFPDHRTAAHCVGYMYHYRCLKCSPYAAHIFDAENDGSPAIFPGFCKPFCARFFDFCRAFIPLITNDTAFRALSENYNGAQEFCEKVVISDRDYCFPNLTRDLKFKREINNTFTSKEDCICLERFATGLKNPLIFRYFPDDSGRIAVGEQMGYLHIYYKNGTKIPEPFMDLSDRVLIARWTGDERGFLGLAFHPNFDANRKFYCYFSAMINGRHMTQLSEFKTLLNNPNKVDTSSERVLLQVEQPYSNHNGGEVRIVIST